jgi:hypothetical protein
MPAPPSTASKAAFFSSAPLSPWPYSVRISARCGCRAAPRAAGLFLAPRAAGLFREKGRAGRALWSFGFLPKTIIYDNCVFSNFIDQNRNCGCGVYDFNFPDLIDARLSYGGRARWRCHSVTGFWTVFRVGNFLFCGCEFDYILILRNGFHNFIFVSFNNPACEL